MLNRHHVDKLVNHLKDFEIETLAKYRIQDTSYHTKRTKAWDQVTFKIIVKTNTKEINKILWQYYDCHLSMRGFSKPPICKTKTLKDY